MCVEHLLHFVFKRCGSRSTEEGKVVFFAGGTGHPYFSTDTGAVFRAIEIEADAMLLAKAIDGIYDSDPKVNPEAKKYDEISIQEIIDKKLMAVDLTASIMCLENKMPMLVFGLNEENSIVETMREHLQRNKSDSIRLWIKGGYHMNEKLKIYDEKMQKTIGNLDRRTCYNPCRTCEPKCAE